jgi:hypothetical protein
VANAILTTDAFATGRIYRFLSMTGYIDQYALAA